MLTTAVDPGVAVADIADVAALNRAEIATRLVAAYPQFIKGVDGNAVVFNDGSTLPLDDGQDQKPFDAWLENPDIKDMFRQNYPAGIAIGVPGKDFDPGRARNEAFFKKIYGDCRSGAVENNLVDIVWLPKKSGARIKVTSVNDVAEKLKMISDELDQLPARFDVDLYPIAGTYNCRAIAGTKNVSAHSYGIAIDIALRHANYWRWAIRDAGRPIRYKNSIPKEIVSAFEKHGFIWGGRWYHYDTMHFEYRPELLTPPSTLQPQH